MDISLATRGMQHSFILNCVKSQGRQSTLTINFLILDSIHYNVKYIYIYTHIKETKLRLPNLSTYLKFQTHVHC